MKTIRRLGVLALTLSLLLTGCNRKPDQTDDKNSVTDTEYIESTDSVRDTEETEAEEPEEPSTEFVVDEGMYKLAFLGVTSMVGDCEDAFSDFIMDDYSADEDTDWTGKTVWAYSFILEMTDSEIYCTSPNIYRKSTEEDLSNIPGKCQVIHYTNCDVFDIDQSYSYIYDVKRDNCPFILYTAEEIPLEDLDIKTSIYTLTDEGGDVLLTINASVEDLSLNPLMASRPLIKCGDSIYLILEDGSGMGVGPGSSGDATWNNYDFKNLSSPFSTDRFDINMIENLQFVDRKTLEDMEPINGCSPFWDDNQYYFRMGFYSDTELPKWPSGEDPTLTTFPKITIEGKTTIISN